VATLHIVQGGIANGDKKWLERAAGTNRRGNAWVAPKSAEIGDEVVFYIGGYGFFATGRIVSPSKPRAGWKNRYGAGVSAIKLIKPAISLAAIRRHIPKLKWAIYPRSIVTPAADLAVQIRALISDRRKTGIPDLTDEALELANIDELRTVALLAQRESVPPRERKILYRARSQAIRLYVLRRANGCCEGCKSEAPFRRADGSFYLEPHHVERLADDGPDHPDKVIGLCPNCHSRAHHSGDKDEFKRSLLKKLARLEPA
jgi:5-methylcytosine-specific restriction endonuclease McrA